MTLSDTFLAVNSFVSAHVSSHTTLILLLIVLWSLIWKGYALWHAARNYQRYWFVALLILNTAGILDIIYLVGFRRDKQPGVTKSLFNNPLPDPDTEPEVAQKQEA